jgi:NADPH2:quinone reductase
MRAVVMTARGGPEVLQYTEVATPKTREPHDVLVRVRAAGVNPVDCKLRIGGTVEHLRGHAAGPGTPGPPILGVEGAGVVEAVGPAVTRVGVGDEIYYSNGGYGLEPGNYAEYTVVDERFVALKPGSLDFPHAGCLPVVLMTAWEALYDRAGLRAGDSVLIHGGGGGIGHIAIQLAKLRDARVATTVSTDDKAALARKVGADCVIRYRTEDVGAAVRSWTGKDGVDVVLDTIGGEVFAAAFGLVASYGTIVSCVQSAWPKDATSAAAEKNLRVGFEHRSAPQIFQRLPDRLRQTAILEDAAKLVDAGKLTVRLGSTYPLAQAADAHRALESGAAPGRTVLTIS